MSASRVLVYGGRGALGSAVVDYFKSKSWVSKYGATHELHTHTYTCPLSCRSVIHKAIDTHMYSWYRACVEIILCV